MEDLTLTIEATDAKILQDELPVLSKIFKTKRKPKKAVMQFSLDEAKWHENPGRSQRYLVGKSMVELGAVGGAGKSRGEIFENCKETAETTKPTYNAVGQILNKLAKE